MINNGLDNIQSEAALGTIVPRRLARVGVVALVLLAFGCKSDNGAMDTNELTAFATRYTAAWCSQEPARVASFFTEDGSLKINDGDPSVGREAITAAARGFMTAFPDMVVEMDSLVAAPEGIEYHWTLTGTNTGPGGTGNSVKISGYEEWTIGSDGLIAESEGHFDEGEYARQLASGINND